MTFGSITHLRHVEMVGSSLVFVDYINRSLWCPYYTNNNVALAVTVNLNSQQNVGSALPVDTCATNSTMVLMRTQTQWMLLNGTGGVLSYGNYDANLTNLGTLYGVEYINGSYYFSVGSKLVKSQSYNGSNPTTLLSGVPNGKLKWNGQYLFIGGSYGLKRIDNDNFVHIPGVSGTTSGTFTGSHFISVPPYNNYCHVSTTGWASPSALKTGLDFDDGKTTKLTEIAHEGNAVNADEIDISFSSASPRSFGYDSANFWMLDGTTIYRFSNLGADDIVYRDDQHVMSDYANANLISWDSELRLFTVPVVTYPASWTPTVTHQHKFDVSAQSTNPIDFHSDGANIWVLDAAGTIYKYNSINGSPVYSGTSYNVTAIDATPTGITGDGTNWWLLGGAGNKLHKLTLAFSALAKPVSLSLPAALATPNLLQVYGNRLLVGDSSKAATYEIDTSGKYLSTFGGNTSPSGIAVKGSDVWLLEGTIAKRYQKGMAFVGLPDAIIKDGIPSYIKIKE